MKVILRNTKISFKDLFDFYREILKILPPAYNLIGILSAIFVPIFYSVLETPENYLIAILLVIIIGIGGTFLLFILMPFLPFIIIPIILNISTAVVFPIYIFTKYFDEIADDIIEWFPSKRKKKSKISPQEIFVLLIEGKSVDEIINSNPGRYKAEINYNIIACLEYAKNLVSEIDYDKIVEQNRSWDKIKTETFLKEIKGQPGME